MNILTEKEILDIYGVPAEGFDLITHLRAKEQYEMFIAGLRLNGVLGVDLANFSDLTSYRDEHGNIVFEVNEE